MKSYEYHLAAQPILQENLQVGVVGFSTVCICSIKGMQCEINFRGKENADNWKCDEAIVTMYIKDAPKTPQTYKRFVVAIDPKDDLAQGCAKVSETILKTTGVQKILVSKQGEIWQAKLENTSLWAAGKTHWEAIGDLVMSHPEQFGVEVVAK